MRQALLVCLAAAAVAAGTVVAAPAGRPPAAAALRQRLSVDLADAPLGQTLALLARRLGLTLKFDEGSPPTDRVTLRVAGVSAETLLVLLAWQADSEWVLSEGVLHWGRAQVLPARDLARSRRQRAARLERLSALLRRRLSQPVPFRLRAQGLKRSALFGFLERRFSIPFLLDARSREQLETAVRADFEDLSLSGLLEAALGGEGSPDGLGWTVVGEVVVIGEPARLHALGAVLR